ncbi:MAG: nucleotidyltransferase [Candidatus Omnitrophica bacterium]|nr:nucleotidyltransferase [Candidatus Omnitrophota bacterium]
MRLEKDFQEFLELLNKYHVKYCIIGGYAVGFYGYPRYTNDIDVLVEPSVENAGKIIEAIKEFGITSSGLGKKDFIEKHKVVQLGYEPIRIDLLTSVAGTSFKTVWANKKRGSYGREKVFFIGLEELIKVKKKANRPVDQIDIDKLKKRNRNCNKK